MKWKTVAIVGAVLFLAGFLSGFIPEYQRASKLAKQLETARLENKLREIRELASLMDRYWRLASPERLCWERAAR